MDPWDIYDPDKIVTVPLAALHAADLSEIDFERIARDRVAEMADADYAYGADWDRIRQFIDTVYDGGFASFVTCTLPSA